MDLESPARQAGRPIVSAEMRTLIGRMSRADIPASVAPRVHGESLKLDIEIGETIVSNYLVRSLSSRAEDHSLHL